MVAPNPPATDDNDAPRLLTVREAAAWLACSQANVYALVEKGDLPVVPVGRRKGYRFDRRDLEAFVEQRKFRYAPAPPRPATKPRLRHLRL